MRRYPIAVFLDRDGTINVDSHFPHDPADLAFLPHALGGLKILSSLPVHIVVVSNQAGIALGHFTESDMVNFNNALRERVSESGGRIDAFYYCPDFEPSNKPPNTAASTCSKPAPGMLIEAAADFGLSLQSCFMVGDKTSDVGAGKAAGCVTVLLKTGKAGLEVPRIPVDPDHVCDNLEQAANLISQRIPAVGNPPLSH